ncbi:MAG: phospho-sugar mutase, partial [Verrucomicrobiae bacterium]|nr:phospho-sugar mutase [Verrucomicrobiae bacterium]
MTPELAAQLNAAKDRGDLLASSHDNIRALLDGASNPLYEAAVSELAGDGAWSELNDRFFTRLAFGTGGLRGRTISSRVTTAERGDAGEGERPDHPCVGTNALN